MFAHKEISRKVCRPTSSEKRSSSFSVGLPWTLCAHLYPSGMLHFLFLASSRAFNRTRDGRMERLLCLILIIHSSRLTSNSGHSAFFPWFARFRRGIFLRFSLLFRHSRHFSQKHRSHALQHNCYSALRAGLFLTCRTQCSFDIRHGKFCCHNEVVIVWVPIPNVVLLEQMLL